MTRVIINAFPGLADLIRSQRQNAFEAGPEKAHPEAELEDASYEHLWQGVSRIDEAAALLSTFNSRHRGGIRATIQNIVEAIEAAAERIDPKGWKSIDNIQAHQHDRIIARTRHGDLFFVTWSHDGCWRDDHGAEVDGIVQWRPMPF